MTRGFRDAVERVRSYASQVEDAETGFKIIGALDDLLVTMPKYGQGMTIAVEDGVVKLGQHGGVWFMEATVNEDGGYVSVTLGEGQLRSLVAYIDNEKAVKS